MHFPEDLYYTREHEWLRPIQDGEALVGITDYAQSQLGDIVYVDIPTVGQTLERGAVFGSVEAVKTVSDLYLPVTATILEKNPLLEAHPEKVNQDPYGEGWMIRIRIEKPEEIEELLRAETYQTLIG
ncbi:MAG: glycine cleavage system protein GcvH [Bacteroidia bacterium]|nr:glycine cleavage system protein GcvH [Bacteroidia bacterium]MCX7763856.1 glycine cleavage system protein GcvH [Bacteroidia bacterium]MDW8057709.1 glycine cleavage system protein GcvH [Bacteroidia bacterium]